MPTVENVDEIEIRSEEVQEILSHIPSWIIRWGTTAILATVVVILISSWFIKYPNTISARIVLTTQTPPTKVIARSGGNIDLRVKDGDGVKQGMLLGIVENPADINDILYVSGKIEEIRPMLVLQGADIVIREDLDLGSLQASYAVFLKSIAELKLIKNLDTYGTQIAALRSSIAYYQELNRQLLQKKQLLQKDMDYVIKDLQRDSLLHSQNAFSDRDFEAKQRNFLQVRNGVLTASSSITQNKIQIVQLQNQIADLQVKKQENAYRLRNNLKESFEQLESQLSAWEQQFLLRASISGKVTFSKYWSDNQYVGVNEEVMTIIPKTQDIFGQVLMPVAGSGKVKISQKVNIKFDNYPSNEFGMVIGQVESISAVPRDNLYTIRVSLPNGLTSSYKKELVFKQEMQGSADIITEDLRLIERVFNQFRSILDTAG